MWENGAPALTAQYAADGERVNKTDGAGAHVNSFRLHDSAGAGTTYTPGFAERKNGQDRYSSQDHLGSTRYLTDSTGNTTPAALRYDAYGLRSASAGTDPAHPTDHQYAGAWGYQREETAGLGLDYLSQRYYDAEVGRFISRDPIQWAGGLNLYGYVHNNPANLVDPSGRAALGHHYVVQEIWRDLPLRPDTRQVLNSGVTGTIPGGHGWSRAHRAYNIAVRGIWDDYLGRRGITPAQLTPSHAQDLIQAVKKSRNPAIRSFLNKYVTQRFAQQARQCQTASKGLNLLKGLARLLVWQIALAPFSYWQVKAEAAAREGADLAHRRKIRQDASAGGASPSSQFDDGFDESMQRTFIRYRNPSITRTDR